MRHAIILTKYQNYLSTTILKHENFLDEVNKSSYVRLLNITQHDAYSITIYLRTMTISYISHEQKDKIPLSN